MIRHLHIQDSDEYYDEFDIDSQHYKRYSQKAVDAIREALPTLDLHAVWHEHGSWRGRHSGT